MNPRKAHNVATIIDSLAITRAVQFIARSRGDAEGDAEGERLAKKGVELLEEILMETEDE